MNTKIVNIEAIGEVSFLKYKSSLKIKIIVKADASIKVTMPQNATYQQAIDFVNSKKQWILDNLKNIKNKNVTQNKITENQKNITPFHDLILIKSKNDKIFITFKDRNLVLNYPENINLEDDRIQNAIKQGIEITLKNEALKYIPQRLKFLADKHNLKFNKLSISVAKRKWGSCSSLNDIIISLHIMRLPLHLIDYVLLHELSHTKVKNHSLEFWNFMQKLDNNSINLNNELKKFKIN